MAEIGLYEAMRTLRAVRRLRPDPIPDEVLRRVLEAATWAPTGGNRQAWRVIVVKDPVRKQRLGESYKKIAVPFMQSYAERFTSLPEAERVKAEKMLRSGLYLAEHFGEAPVLCIFCFHPDGLAVTDADLNRVSVVGGGSIYPAVQNLLLACRAEGLGCVLTTLLCKAEPEVRELLAIPQPWGTAAAVPIGYPQLRGHGPLSRRPVEEMAFIDSWEEPFA
ncbi:MAG TPA: nitroreductase family protein [Candidatus Binatia bacterium]|nr:nitroreductase family protein [Candidatus Binatia bacterium]